jgi:hypothetical protein
MQKQKKLFKAIMEFHDKDEKKVKRVIIGLHRSNDITAEIALEMIEELDVEDVDTRAKTITPSTSYDPHIPTRQQPKIVRPGAGSHGASNDRC